MSPQLLERFEYIETALFWEKGLTAGGLRETFHLSRQTAQSVIDQYRQAHPDAMVYDASRKCHRPTRLFSPQYISGDVIRFLDYLRGQTLVGYFREAAEWSRLEVHDVDRLLQPKLPLEPARTVLRGLREERAVRMDYRKKNLSMSERMDRIVSPNHLVFSDGRYHVRAYCHVRKAYLDFVLTRIIDATLLDDSTAEWVSDRYDEKWQTFLALTFEPHPELPESVREAILQRFDAEETGRRRIPCRAALAFYVERRLAQSIDPKYGVPLWRLVSEERVSG
jgi:predicted DNA-binding transcriptional regulator YafY